MTKEEKWFWQKLLAVYLHDPPDKPLDIRGHMNRATENYEAVFSVEESPETMKGEADKLASHYERLPAPDYSKGELARKTIVGVGENGTLSIRHPLQAGSRVSVECPVELPRKRIAETAKAISESCDDARIRYYSIWRRWKGELSQEFDWIDRLPAETRNPDHTIWNHLDTAAAFAAPELRTKSGGAWGLLSFKLSPVQAFIEQGRSTRDVFTGSFLLAWLVFKAMEPVIESYGPSAFVYPYLRETPLMDWWLTAKGVRGVKPKPEEVIRANYPNRFVAVIANGDGPDAAEHMAAQVVDRCRAAWKGIATDVKKWLQQRDPFGNSEFAGWDVNWDSQIESFFSVQASFLPGNVLQGKLGVRTLALFDSTALGDISPESQALTSIAEAIAKEGHETGYLQQRAEWQFLMQLSALLMDTHSRVKHVPPYFARPDDEGKYPQKCTLLGTYEQVGPGDRARNDTFWNLARESEKLKHRIRKGEKLCAISLVKRLAFPAYFNRVLDLGKDDTRFPDTATLAATIWLRKAGVSEEEILKPNWNGQWLHRDDREAGGDEEALPDWLRRKITDAKTQESGPSLPPTYYAILLMDGDSMGDWLSGRHPDSPTLQDAYAEQLREYFHAIGAKQHLKARRPVGPALHAAISEALGHFSTAIVPEIVEHFQGKLIYAGGDDVLAFLPLENALACALDIQLAYTGQSCELFEGDGTGWLARKSGESAAKKRYLTMGRNAGISAGVAIVHYHEDLRVAFDHARAAEKLAKTAKRNGISKPDKDRLGVALAKRSGEVLKVNCLWSFVPILNDYVQRFKSGATDAWARQVQREIAMWEELEAGSMGCVESEIRRAIVRSEERRHFPEAEVFAHIRELVSGFAGPRESDAAKSQPHGKGPYAEFLNLVHTASFLARGRDE